MSLLSVAEAQARLLALPPPLPVERAGLVEAAGRWAAEDVVARRAQPAADLSAMDGYALRFAELPGPWRVAGESRAGRALDRPLGWGEAARIFTGAPLPEGADTVLAQEEARAEGDLLRLAGHGPRVRGEYVRAGGSDFASGGRLVAAGERLTPARVALAAMGGHGAIAVRRRPGVLILSTGDELVPAGAPAPGVLLPASNGPMLAAMLKGGPARVEDGGILPDRLETLADAFAAAARTADIIVTTGGASVGDHDLVRPALIQAGAALDFWRIAMRPGKPLLAARLGDAVVLGLPGNPVSAFVTAHLFLLPLVGHLAGDPAPLPGCVPMRLAMPLPGTGPRAEYLRARTEGERVHPLAGQDSAGVAALAQADALIVRPPHAPPAAEQNMADVIRFA